MVQVKQLFDMLMRTTNHSNERASEEDAMFTKKPLGGNSCASCERNITNLYGHIAEYQAWKKLPFREPGERIARVTSSPYSYIDYSTVKDSQKYFQ